SWRRRAPTTSPLLVNHSAGLKAASMYACCSVRLSSSQARGASSSIREARSSGVVLLCVPFVGWCCSSGCAIIETAFRFKLTAANGQLHAPQPSAGALLLWNQITRLVSHAVSSPHSVSSWQVPPPATQKKHPGEYACLWTALPPGETGGFRKACRPPACKC